MSSSGRVLTAAILAGGGPDNEVAAACAAPCKALAEVGGRPLIEYVLDALRGARSVGGIIAIEAPSRTLSRSGAMPVDVPIFPARGERMIDSFVAAADACPTQDEVMIVTADLPLLTSAAVDGFVSSCQDTQCGLSYPVVRADAFDQAFPGRGKTVARLREGRFTGGNLAIVSRRFVAAQAPAIARTLDRRKSPIGMARIFGFRFVLRLLAGTLSISDLERRGGEMLGTKLAAVPVQWPEIGFDVDHPEDLELAGRFLTKRSAAL